MPVIDGTKVKHPVLTFEEQRQLRGKQYATLVGHTVEPDTELLTTAEQRDIAGKAALENAK